MSPSDVAAVFNSFLSKLGSGTVTQADVDAVTEALSAGAELDADTVAGTTPTATGLAVLGAESSDVARSVLAADSEIALWAMDDAGSLVGYTAAQIASDYAGAPAVVLSGPGNYFGILYDGSIVVGTAGADYWYIVPKELQAYSSALDTTKLRRVDVVSGMAQARLVTQFPNGDVMLSASKGVRLTLQQLYGGWSAGGIVVDGWTTGAIESHVDASGNLWVVDYGADTLARYTSATVSAAGTATADKVATGTNFNGITGVAFDAAGGAWHTSYDDNVLRYHNAAAVAALNGTPSNPAATRSITGLTGGLENVVLDRDGGAWVGAYDTGNIYYLTSAQLTAGGAQSPTRTIEPPMATLTMLRMSSGTGLYLR